MAILHELDRPTVPTMCMLVHQIATQQGRVQVVVSWEFVDERPPTAGEIAWLGGLSTNACRDPQFEVLPDGASTGPDRLRINLFDFTPRRMGYAVIHEVQSAPDGPFATLLCGEVDGLVTKQDNRWVTAPPSPP